MRAEHVLDELESVHLLVLDVLSLVYDSEGSLSFDLVDLIV